MDEGLKERPLKLRPLKFHQRPIEVEKLVDAIRTSRRFGLDNKAPISSQKHEVSLGIVSGLPFSLQIAKPLASVEH